MSTGDPGSVPNEFLQVTFPNSITHVTIAGDPSGGSFTLDDLSFAQVTTTQIPEPATLLLFVSGLLEALLSASRRVRKRLLSSLLGTAAIAAFVLCTPSIVWAVRAVDAPKADAHAFFTNAATALTVTARVAVDPDLIPNSVTLVRVNNQGQSIAVLGRMYDDGTHGDAVSGDGTFTAQITLTEAQAGNVGLAVTAAYRGTLLRTRSATTVISAVRKPTDVEIQQVGQITDAGSAFFAARRPQIGDEQARRDLVAYLKAQPGVAEAQISIDGTTISILFTSGLTSGIFTSPPGTQGGGGRVPSTSFFPSFASASSSTTGVTYPRTTQAIVLAPFFDDFSPNDASADIADHLSHTCAGRTDPVLNEAVTVDVMKTLGQYGVIYINTHSGIMNIQGADQMVLATREPWADLLLIPQARLRDWVTGLVVPIETDGLSISGFCVASCRKVWAITPKFIGTYTGSLPGSIAYLSGCNTSTSFTMSNALIAAGAQVVFGYDNTLNESFGKTTGTMVFGTLTNMSLYPEERTVAKAWLPASFLQDSTNAILTFKGNPATALCESCAGHWEGTVITTDGSTSQQETFQVSADIIHTASDFTATFEVMKSNGSSKQYSETGKINGTSLMLEQNSPYLPIMAEGEISPDWREISGAGVDPGGSPIPWSGSVSCDESKMSGTATSSNGDTVTWSLDRP